MRCRKLTLALLAFVYPLTARSQPGRLITLREGEVAQVRTAVGYSTLIQFDARPTSVVLGDQDAFKVEYVGNGLSIKPSLSATSTNLFVFTDYEQFSFKLTNTKGAPPDYSLRVKRKKQVPASTDVQLALNTGGASHSEPTRFLKTVRVNHVQAKDGATLRVESLSLPPSRTAVVVQFSVSYRIRSREETPLRQPALSVVHQGRALPIQDLYLSAPKLSGAEAVSEGILILRTGVLRGISSVDLNLVFPTRASSPLGMQLPLDGLFEKEAKHGTKMENR